ncbi:hypothetical protein CAEBREN_13040 [Caenorhabditis brenneri]|uniref:Uncharacterized protein n=1 Tax=Caenorhabditis brenneri TaxID=135651 RepID=G0NKQ8_CAEBE|nr:hypothetical protein CAEBREN_13040 [Caenorhabditis brenneri]
MPHNALQKII